MESAQPTPQPQPEAAQDMTGLDEKNLYAALSYVAVLVFIPLLTQRNDPYVSFHARQGLVILVGYVIAIIVAIWISWLGSLLAFMLLLANVVALFQALQGRTWKIPGIGMLAEKFQV